MTTTQEVGTMRETCDHNGCGSRPTHKITATLETASQDIVTCDAHTANMVRHLRSSQELTVEVREIAA